MSKVLFIIELICRDSNDFDHVRMLFFTSECELARKLVLELWGGCDNQISVFCSLHVHS